MKLVWAASVALLVACSSSSRAIDDSTQNGSADGGSGPSTSKDAGGDATTKTSVPPKLCVPERCTQQEAQDYADCYTGKCDDTFKQCYGDDYPNGNYDGVCASYKSCIDACDCDLECRSKCKLDGACKTCLDPAASKCSQQCTSPTCYLGAVISGFTCQDLNTCCHKIQAPDQQQGCLSIWGYYGANGSNNDCERVYVSDYANLCN